MQNDVRLEPVTSPFAVTDAALESVEFPQIHDAFDNAHMAYMYIQMYGGQAPETMIKLKTLVELILNSRTTAVTNEQIVKVARELHNVVGESKVSKI